MITIIHHNQQITEDAKIEKLSKKKPKRVRTVEGSCNQCLKKRVKCSLNKPSCDKCVKLNHVCTYNKVNLKWGKFLNGSSKKTEFTVSQQGRRPMNLLFKGAKISKLKPETNKCDLISTFISSQAETVGQEQSGELIISESTTSSSTFNSYLRYEQKHETQVTENYFNYKPNSFDLLISNSPTPKELLKYFQVMILPRFHAYGETTKDLDLTNISLNPLLQNFSETIAAFHMFNYQNNRITEVDLRRKKLKSVKLLADELEKTDKRPSKLEDLFICCVLLGSIDGMINTEVSEISPSHLFGSRAILSQLISESPSRFLNLRRNIVSNLTARILSLFNTMDLIYSFLTGNNQTLMNPQFWYNFNETDAWFGCVSADDPLLCVLEKLSVLSNQGYHFKLMGYVDLFHQEEPLMNINHFLQLKSIETESVGSIFASAFADVGLIYYHRVFLKKQVNDFEIQNIVHWFIHKIRSQIINQEKYKGDKNILNHCLLSPLLIIGAHCITLEDQSFVRNLICKSYQSLQFMNVALLINFLDQLWALINNNIELINNISWWSQFREISNCSFIF